MRDHKLHHIDLVFENCDYVSFDEKYLGDIEVKDFVKSIHRVACNAIDEVNICRDVAIEVFSEGDSHYLTFGMDEGKTKFERILAWNDITQIEFYFVKGYDENGNEIVDEIPDRYYTDYDEGGKDYSLGAPNINQASKLSELGNLYIVIHPENGASENGRAMLDKRFPDDEINDAEEKQFQKRMCGVIEREDMEHDDPSEDTSND